MSLIERLFAADGGIVDQDIDAAEAFERGVGNGLHRLGVGHVTGDGDGLPAGALDLAHDIVGFLPVGARIDHDGCAVGRERQRNGAADIAARSGDDGDAAA